MNNARETERERETLGTIYYTCSLLVSLLTCIAHNYVNTCNSIWKKKKKKKKKKKRAGSLIFQRKGMLCIGYARVNFTHMSTNLYLTNSNTRNKES